MFIEDIEVEEQVCVMAVALLLVNLRTRKSGI